MKQLINIAIGFGAMMIADKAGVLNKIGLGGIGAIRKKDQPLMDYLIEHIDADGYGENPTTPEEKVKWLKKTFLSEYGWAVKQMGTQKALKEWLQGVPSAINLPIYYSDIIPIMENLGQLKKNASEKETDKFLENFYNVIAFRLMQLFEKYKA